MEIKLATGREGTDPATRRLAWAGGMLGVGLGGFFDGILLHQILQWHHLLSAVEGANASLRTLVLADGLFHALMYVLVGVGLWLLWRRRADLGLPGVERRVVGAVLVGFGVWHVLDAVLSHWLLGIHRIRMDTDIPLLWDLGWLAAFGLVPLALGWALSRAAGDGGGRGAGMRMAVLALLVVGAGVVAARPPPADAPVMVLFRSGTPAPEVFATAARLDARVVWGEPQAGVWALALPAGADALQLYRHGAILVGGHGLPAGCFGWSRA